MLAELGPQPCIHFGVLKPWEVNLVEAIFEIGFIKRDAAHVGHIVAEILIEHIVIDVGQRGEEKIRVIDSNERSFL